MESRNLDRALDIVSKLINGENVGENGDNAASGVQHKCTGL